LVCAARPQRDPGLIDILQGKRLQKRGLEDERTIIVGRGRREMEGGETARRRTMPGRRERKGD